jgi:E3 ubiquitin-protein ligase DOA10
VPRLLTLKTIIESLNELISELISLLQKCILAAFLGLIGNTLEHRGVLQHIRDDNKPHLTASNENLIKLECLAVTACHVNVI